MPRAPKSTSSKQPSELPLPEKVMSEKRKRGVLIEQGEEYVGVRNPGRPDGRFIDSVASKDYGPDIDDEVLINKRPKYVTAQLLASIWDPLRPPSTPVSFSGVNRST